MHNTDEFETFFSGFKSNRRGSPNTAPSQVLIKLVSNFAVEHPVKALKNSFSMQTQSRMLVLVGDPKFDALD